MLIQEPVTVLLRALPLVVLDPPSDAASPGTRAEWFGVPQLALAGEGNGNPLQCSCLENPHGQRSLSGYSPWGHKELDMTEVT